MSAGIPVVVRLKRETFDHWEAEAERRGVQIEELLEQAADHACVPLSPTAEFVQHCRQRYLTDVADARALDAERPRRRALVFPMVGEGTR